MANHAPRRAQRIRIGTVIAHGWVLQQTVCRRRALSKGFDRLSANGVPANQQCLIRWDADLKPRTSRGERALRGFASINSSPMCPAADHADRAAKGNRQR